MDVWAVDVPSPELASYSGPHSLCVSHCKVLGGTRMDAEILVVTCRMVLVCSSSAGGRPLRKALVENISGILVSSKPADVGSADGTLLLLRFNEEPDLLLLLPDTPPGRKDPLDTLEVVYFELTSRRLDVIYADKETPKLLSIVSVDRPRTHEVADEKLVHHNIKCKCHSKRRVVARSGTPTQKHQGVGSPVYPPSFTPAERLGFPVTPAEGGRLGSPHQQRMQQGGQHGVGGGGGGGGVGALEELQVRFNTQRDTHTKETGALKQQIAQLKRQLLLQARDPQDSPSNFKLRALRGEVKETLKKQAEEIVALKAELETERAGKKTTQSRSTSISRSDPILATVYETEIIPTRVTSIHQTQQVYPGASQVPPNQRPPSRYVSPARQLRGRSASPAPRQTPPRVLPPNLPHYSHNHTTERSTSPLPQSAMEAGTDPIELECYWRPKMVSQETMTHAGGAQSARRQDGPVKDVGVMVQPACKSVSTSMWHTMVGEVTSCAMQTDAGYTFDKGTATSVAYPFSEQIDLLGPQPQTPNKPVEGRHYSASAVASIASKPSVSRYSGTSTSLPDFDEALALDSLTSLQLASVRSRKKDSNPHRASSVSTTTSDLDTMLRECSELLGKSRDIEVGRGGGVPSGRRKVPPSAPQSVADPHSYWYPLADGSIAGFSREGAQEKGYVPGTELTLQEGVFTIVGTLNGKLYGHREDQPGAVCIQQLL